LGQFSLPKEKESEVTVTFNRLLVAAPGDSHQNVSAAEWWKADSVK
jgi:hypothetical protein